MKVLVVVVEVEIPGWEGETDKAMRDFRQYNNTLLGRKTYKGGPVRSEPSICTQAGVVMGKEVRGRGVGGV